MNFVKSDGDASALIEKECYMTWVKSRKNPPLHPSESYRRVLTAHLCGLSRRKPFPEKVERSLLNYIRQKKPWPCFKGTNISIGIRGFRKQGFHELQLIQRASKIKPIKIKIIKQQKSHDSTSDFDVKMRNLQIQFLFLERLKFSLSELNPLHLQ